MNAHKCIKLILITFLLIEPAMAQTWISSNAVWYYNYEAPGGVKGYHKISYISDTVIDGQPCEYLQVVQQSYVPSGPPNWNYIPLDKDTLQPRFTFMRNDTVFYYNEDQFSILYCMDAVGGQSWDLGVDTNELLCSRSIVYVEYTDMINLNGQYWPMLYVSSSPDASFWLYGRVIGRFGAYDRYLFPMPNSCDTSIAVEYNEFFFSCYEDDDFPLIQVNNYDCDNPLAVGINEPVQTSKTMTVYPNPASKLVYFRIHPHSMKTRNQILITDFLGKAKYSKYLNEEVTAVDISGFPGGIYYIILFKNGLPAEHTKLIVN
jgi:hypothetical protein